MPFCYHASLQFFIPAISDFKGFSPSYTASISGFSKDMILDRLHSQSGKQREAEGTIPHVEEAQ
jgi:hypothetical protein